MTTAIAAARPSTFFIVIDNFGRPISKPQPADAKTPTLARTYDNVAEAERAAQAAAVAAANAAPFFVLRCVRKVAAPEVTVLE